MKKLVGICAAVVALAGTVFATTWDNTVGGTNGYPAFLGRPVYTVARTLNMATYTNTVAEDDVIKLINIPATSVVLEVSYCIPTAFTNDVWFDLGDNSDADKITAEIDATNATWATETLYATPWIKVNNGDIRITGTNAAAGHTGIIRVKAAYIDMNEY